MGRPPARRAAGAGDRYGRPDHLPSRADRSGAPVRGRDEQWRERNLTAARQDLGRTYLRASGPADPDRPAAGSARSQRPGAGRRSSSAGGGDGDAAAPARRIRRKPIPGDVASEIKTFGAPRQAAALEAKLTDAARAYERERYSEALSALRDLARAMPAAASVRELYGLTLYRLGRWKEALRELQAFVELSGSVDQHPVLADCERALGNHARVEVLWSELRTAGAGSDVLAEGRLVMAGSLADRGRFADAIALVEPAALRAVRKPLDRHVRQWYSLADLYERSGDLPRARDLFRKVVDADPDLSDALERLAALR